MSVPTRKEDLPLHEDVRWLAGALGRVIQRLEGKEAFEIVERLRSASRARRHGEAGCAFARRHFARSGRSHSRAVRDCRASIHALLSADQHRRADAPRPAAQRVPRQGSREPQPASARWTMRQLRKLGASARRDRAGDAARSTSVPCSPRTPPNRRAAHCSVCRRASPTICSRANRPPPTKCV